MDCSIPGFPIHHQLREPTQTHVHHVSDAIKPSHPLSSPSPPAPNPSQLVFSNESTLHMRWPKYWSFSFSISPSNEYSGLISFRMNWFDLLEIQGTLKSLLQYHRSKASMLWHSAFFTVQLLHPYKWNLQWGITSQRSEWSSSKCLQIINAEENMEEKKPSYTILGNVNWHSHYKEQYGGHLKYWK